MSASTSFHTETDLQCDIDLRLWPTRKEEGREAYAYITARIPNAEIVMFFSDPKLLNTLADKCREAAEFLRAQAKKDVKL